VSIFLPKDCRTYRYNFYLQKQRYAGSTGQVTRKDAEEWEREYQRKIRRQLGGLDPTPAATLRIQDWAEVYFDRVLHDPRMRITRPARVQDNLRVLLRFWGAKPSGKDQKNPIIAGEPYHDLLLTDPITEPDWLVQFEDWIEARGRAGQTNNQYRSTMSQLYRLALQPKWRKKTGVAINPFLGIYRDRTGRREVAITPDDLRRLLQHASYHVRLALAIGALAPKLRLGNILALRWAVHLDAALQFITVHEHKTAAHTSRPLVVPIRPQLREILEDARRRNPDATHVIEYRGRAVKSIRGGVKAAARTAGLPYGRKLDDGMTFHTLRHTAATLLAELDVAEKKRQLALGHKRLETTQRYTHLRPMHEIPPLDQLSASLPIADLVTLPWRRASRKGAVSAPVLGEDCTPGEGGVAAGTGGNAAAAPKSRRAR
jgi:integrase